MGLKCDLRSAEMNTVNFRVCTDQSVYVSVTEQHGKGHDPRFVGVLTIGTHRSGQSVLCVFPSCSSVSLFFSQIVYLSRSTVSAVWRKAWARLTVLQYLFCYDTSKSIKHLRTHLDVSTPTSCHVLMVRWMKSTWCELMWFIITVLHSGPLSTRDRDWL